MTGDPPAGRKQYVTCPDCLGAKKKWDSYAQRQADCPGCHGVGMIARSPSDQLVFNNCPKCHGVGEYAATDPQTGKMHVYKCPKKIAMVIRQTKGPVSMAGREQHYGDVSVATDQIGRLQELFAMATEQVDVAMGAIIQATGAADVESAQNAMNFISGLRDRIQEMHGICNAASEELARYGNGF